MRKLKPASESRCVYGVAARKSPVLQAGVNLPVASVKWLLNAPQPLRFSTPSRVVGARWILCITPRTSSCLAGVA